MEQQAENQDVINLNLSLNLPDCKDDQDRDRICSAIRQAVNQSYEKLCRDYAKNQKMEPAASKWLTDDQRLDVQMRRDDILSRIAWYLAPRRNECRWHELDMRDLGRCLGLMQAAIELQAHLEVDERGLDAREAILNELDNPPFKKFPRPAGWGTPCQEYIRKCLYSSESQPILNWPLNGGSEAGF